MFTVGSHVRTPYDGEGLVVEVTPDNEYGLTVAVRVPNGFANRWTVVEGLRRSDLVLIAEPVSAGLDPWRPGAHDEERLVVGILQTVDTPSVALAEVQTKEAIPPRGSQPAPGGAGKWTPRAHYACGGVPYITMSRWLVPVQS